ncbi:ParB N-terminal domain-containing protein [Ferrovibrio sp.]|uniref:ParB N-terminal domain-containing protein n=1 Tax=Ferrovibrio sp. TaxID=1917215 RepID=UPI0025BB0620|nr:ParB N-terminal domain-containing protein [Ferrovibrio sp.]MBX3456507.1 ParB N-terminal domain-containing protein [Ferrovibrio sp.]
MMKATPIPLEKIYVPTRLRGTVDQAKVEALAEDIVSNGMTTPIQVRVDGARFVLVAGLHRLEAIRYLGEKTITAFTVQARKA